jgi:hypothetical protein
MSKVKTMPWVVTSWKPEVIAAAEREARRRTRAAGREVADAAAYLTVLEELGAELRERVRLQRRELPPPLPIPAKRPAPPPEPEPAPAPSPARKGRATLRDSPLGELFKATAQPAATARSGSRAGEAGRQWGLANSACASPMRCSEKPASQ